MRDETNAPAWLVTDLRDIFGARLRAVIVYGDEAHPPLRTLAHVDSLTLDDLRRSAASTDRWSVRGVATPLFVPGDEFARSLDAFPLEYSAIIANHRVVYGSSPFAGLHVRPDDVRRACEVQAKSHLLHLREGFVESAGRGDEIAALIVASAAPFRTLLQHVARLQGQDALTTEPLVQFAESIRLAPDVVRPIVSIRALQDLGPIEAERLFPAYLDAAEQLARFVDRWTAE